MGDLKAPQATAEEKARVRQYIRQQRAALRAPVTPVITIFVRHTPGCKYAGDEFCKRCNCRKHFRWSQNGTQYRRKAGTRSWAEAEDVKRRLEDQLAGRVSAPETDGQTIRAAVDVFMNEKKAGDCAAYLQARYRRELDRFTRFAEQRGIFVPSRITLPMLTDYRLTWVDEYPSSATRKNVQARLKSFLLFCNRAGWLDRVPKMAPVTVEYPPTMPVTPAEYDEILAAVPLEFTNGAAGRIRAIIQLMRWSGLAIRDASCIRRKEIIKGKDYYSVLRSRQKTGTDVHVPIPVAIGDEVLKAAIDHPEYLFWEPRTNRNAAFFAAQLSVKVRRVFERAGVISEGHLVSHRLRDTFAADLLQKGVSLEHVSKLLGHKSVITTERHYAKWVRGRQELLERVVSATWKK